MTDHTTRCADEAKTYELFYDYEQAHSALVPGYNHDVVVVGMVFKAMHYASLPVSRIKTIGMAMANLVSWDNPEAILNTLTKAKVLRSRMIRGERHYKVNY